jgi:acetyl esterase/lipase
MKILNVDLYEYFGVERLGAGGRLICFLHENSREISLERRYPAMLVLPGGGYSMCSDREAEPIAEQYYSKGFNAFILRYSVHPDKYPAQLCEAAMAMAYIRRESSSQFSDAEHVATIGFSAGGHLCGSIATMYADEVVAQKTGVTPSEARPDASILSYAVINPELGLSGGTFNFLCDMNPEILPFVTIDERVNENTPPLFIWHTVNDNCVDIRNALKIANAAVENNVPFAMHVFERGQHGLSVADLSVYGNSVMPTDVSTDAYKWLELSVNWLRDHGFRYKD